MMTFILAYLDAHNIIGAPGIWWYVGTVIMDLMVLGANLD